MKKLLSVLLAILMVITIIPLGSIQTSAAAPLTEEEFVNKIATLKAKYASGLYWSDSYGKETIASGIKVAKVGKTQKCSSVYSCDSACGSFSVNGSEMAWQCRGYAYMLSVLLFDSCPKYYKKSKWSETTSFSSLYAGDIVIYPLSSGGTHTIFIYKVSGTTVYYTDCNYSAPCKIRWDKKTTVSELKKLGASVRHYSGNTLKGVVTTNSLTFNYSANGGTVATSNTYKTTDALNLRSSASTSGTVLLTIPEGTTITVTSTKTGGGYTWGKTTYGGKTGWCALDYTTRQGYYVSSDMIYQYSNKKLVSHSWNYGSGCANGLWNAASFGLTKNGYTFGGWSKDKTITSSSKIFDENDNTLKAEDIDASVANGSKTITLYAVWDPIKVQSVKIKTLPNKTIYRIGESFDSTGLTLTATYSDGSTKQITSGYTVNGFNSSTVGQKTITITYEGKSVAISVTVEETPHTCAFTTFSHHETAHPHYAVYECTCGNKNTDTTKTTTVDSCETCNPPHTCTFATFSHYEVVHPHYAVYTCSCGTPKVDTTKTTKIESCEDCNPSTPNYDFSISIQQPSRTTIRCKDGIVLHANLEGTLPEGAKIVWNTNNSNFTEKQIDENTFQIISNNKGYTTITVSIIDADNDVLIIDEVEMYSKAGFGDKIGGFFRSLFGATKIYES